MYKKDNQEESLLLGTGKALVYVQDINNEEVQEGGEEKSNVDAVKRAATASSASISALPNSARQHILATNIAIIICFGIDSTLSSLTQAILVYLQLELREGIRLLIQKIYHHGQIFDPPFFLDRIIHPRVKAIRMHSHSLRLH